MNPLHPDRQHQWSHLVLALFVAALPLLLVAPIMVWQEHREQLTLAEQAVGQTLLLLDEQLNQSALEARALQPLIGHACDDSTLLALRQQVTAAPAIRSASLTIDGGIYCSSLSGDVDQHLDSKKFIHNGLELRPGSKLTPAIPLITNHLLTPRGGVLVTIDSRYLQLVLRSVGVHDRDSYVEANGIWLGPKLRTGSGTPPRHGTVLIQARSTHYPYQVSSSFDLKSWYQVLWQQQAALSSVLLVLGLLAGASLYRLLSRPTSPQQELRRALANDEFEPFLQPIVKPGQDGWMGAEVLMRWRHPQEGLIRPDLFIPHAEECGLIVAMTQKMMRKVVATLRTETLPKGFHLGFNVSTAHFHLDDLYQDCCELLAAFPPGSMALTLELTERELLEVTPAIEALFLRLDQLGVKIALDDFGTGHSSLVYLQQLKVDGLKIDQSFVARIGSDSLSGHIVDSVVELASKLGLETVAEGVETEQQRDYLTRLGVGWLQGYLIARPMPLAQFVQGLRAQ